MYGVLPLVFGEIARICQSVNPTSLRVIWWDTKVRGEQVFTSRDFAQVAKLMAPQGGGGTTVSCVAQHIRAKAYKPKATIMLTDGYVESSYEVPAGNVLWGVVGNARFRPPRGRVLHIEEV
jgi:predicted metal-dependent peptidase